MSFRNKTGISESGLSITYPKGWSNLNGADNKGMLSGTYTGTVVDDHDPLKMNRVQIYIPALSAMSFDPNNYLPVDGGTHKDKKNGALPKQENRLGYFNARIKNPYGGSDDWSTGIAPDGRNSKDGESISYGTHFPTRIGDQVSIQFMNNNANEAMITGAIPKASHGNTMPSEAMAQKKDLDQGNAKDAVIDKTSDKSCLPVTEKTPSEKDPNSKKRAHSTPLGSNIVRSGTGRDIYRGAAGGGHARRESPSLVSGQRSPGWNFSRDKHNRDSNGTQWKNRGGNTKRFMSNGSSITMDDNPDTAGMVIRSGQNNAIIMRDGANNPFIHMQTQAGNAYISLDNNGNISIYGKKDLKLRAVGNLELYSDKKIILNSSQDTEIAVGKNLNISAFKEMNLAVNDTYRAVYNGARHEKVIGDYRLQSKGVFDVKAKTSTWNVNGLFALKSANHIAFESGGNTTFKTGGDFIVVPGGKILLNSGDAKSVEDSLEPEEAKFRKVEKTNVHPEQKDVLKGEASKKKEKQMGKKPSKAPDSELPNNGDTEGTNGGVGNKDNGQEQKQGDKAVNSNDQQPVEGARVSSEYGGRSDPFTGRPAGHAGMDLAAPGGTPIKSLSDGKVVYSDFSSGGDGYGGYGNVVAVKDSNGVTTVYGHLQNNSSYNVGDTVRTGDVIGNVGSTGRSTGNHLHLETRVSSDYNGAVYRPTGAYTVNPRTIYPNLR